MAKFCANCGNELNEDQDICLKCGTQVKKSTAKVEKEAKTTYCGNCGSELKPGQDICLKCGVKVNEFTLGLGPTLFSWGKGETKYCLKALPFGGSCVMEGEDEESDSDRAFNKKTLWERFQIVFAGPLFNFILGCCISCVFFNICAVDNVFLFGILNNAIILYSSYYI